MKTLADIVVSAMDLCGVGVLALGRSMRTHTTAKHNIKRVNRFLGNEEVEGVAIACGLFDAFAPKYGRVVVLADWTDVVNGKMLVFALPCNGRSVPFFTKVVAKHAGEGGLIRAENEALQILKRICATRSDVIIVADRGFGNQRWLGAVREHGFHFVQRLSCVFYAETEHHIGGLKELNVRRGKPIRDWGHGTIGEDEAIVGRLVTAYDKKAKEPWYLVTDLDEATAHEVVSIYRRRYLQDSRHQPVTHRLPLHKKQGIPA
ncbi:MAG: transposase [Candidatus Hydrogenedentes bacterium]|nr:transposase [Candidatus Hydrogenedentota bacterium]